MFYGVLCKFALVTYTIIQIEMSSKRPLNIDELNANHYTVSVHKYGFFVRKARHEYYWVLILI